MSDRVYFLDARYGREAQPGEAPCATCGYVHLVCNKHTQDPEGSGRYRQCGKPPRKGASVCWKHGGAAPQVIAAADRKVALGRLTAELEREGRLGGGEVDTTPEEAMLAMVREAAWNVAVLRDLVAQLPLRVALPTGDEDAPHPLASIAGLIGSQSKVLEAAPHVLVGMYDAERERLVRWSKMCRDAGVDEAIVALETRHVDALQRVITATCEGLLRLACAVVEAEAPAAVGLLRRRWEAELPAIVAGAIDEGAGT